MSLQLILLLVSLSSLPSSEAHCRLLQPPSRSSAWRFDSTRPANYNDNELNCGGANNQWGVHGGKCGLCGDPYEATVPRENERGGKYGTGSPVATYKEGETIEIKAEMTANHKGWFEVKVCPTNDGQTRATQECLDQYVLKLQGSTSTRYYVPERSGMMLYRVELPVGLTCSWCVLQWRYHAGNSWGAFPGERGCIGCGAQEEFYGCADIVITQSTEGISRFENIRHPAETIGGSGESTHTTEVIGELEESTHPADTYSSPAQPPSDSPSAAIPVCCSVPPYSKTMPSRMDGWCKTNCEQGYCPATHCKCSGC